MKVAVDSDFSQDLLQPTSRGPFGRGRGLRSGPGELAATGRGAQRRRRSQHRPDQLPCGRTADADRPQSQGGHRRVQSLQPDARGERRRNWTAVPEPARICTMEAWILSPGETLPGRLELPGDLVAGRYRAVLGFSAGSLEPSAVKLEARTPPFTVEQ